MSRYMCAAWFQILLQVGERDASWLLSFRYISERILTQGHNYNFKNSPVYNVPLVKHEFAKQSIRYKIPHLFNNMDPSIRQKNKNKNNFYLVSILIKSNKSWSSWYSSFKNNNKIEITKLARIKMCYISMIHEIITFMASVLMTCPTST